ncbi:class I SAM-dependent methyltransferase [Methanocella sp. MCL-LM]|uniref:class I SAM-dependent methyltransferase n=1 Tax=Methanocella sp. MCL-LM TaxID=3412035 RepID=UPI003C743DE1
MGDSEKNFSYLDMLASTGYARHIGGKAATDVLVEKAKIGPDFKVLDVGCGIGKTSCRLAADHGCTVTGIDIMPQMVEKSSALAKRLRLDGKVTFRQGDARELPFEDNSFDAVFVESVTIFVEDVPKAISEYRRVVKPGGIVCDNEVCITRASHEKLKDDINDLEAIFSAFSSKTSQGYLTYDDWKETFEKQFPTVEATHYVADPQVEMEAKKADGMGTFVTSTLKTMWLYATNPEAKRIIDTTQKMYKYVGHFGYGLFVCRK